ncbi:MAG: two-component regulator propeller domain-containing protein, partial [bacterium]
MFSSNYRLGIIGVLLALSISAGFASERMAGSHALRRYLVNIENIPSPTFGKVHAILRDRHGFIWFGTTNGLHKYDGNEVRVLKIIGGNHEEQRFVTAIIQNGDSSLLLAAWRGLWIFNPSTEQSVPFLQNIRFGDGRISSLVEGKNHKLWIGTQTGGLFCYDRMTAQLRSYTTAEGLSDNTIICLFVDRSGIVWVGTHKGLNSLDPASGHVVQYRSRTADKNSLSFDEVMGIDEITRDELWIGTRNGLDRWNRKTDQFQRFLFNPAKPNDIWAIAHDPMGRIWFSQSEAGLFMMDNDSITQIGSPESSEKAISDPHINTLYVDPTSTATNVLLWAGTRDGGLDRLHLIQNQFSTFIRNNNLPVQGNGAFLSLCEDHRGILWAGLWGGGLNALRLSDGKATLLAHHTHDPNNKSGLPSNTVSSIVEDKTGILWIGTPDGLASLDSNRRIFTVYQHRDGDSTSLAANAINKVYLDRSGELWVCTAGGLSRLEKGRQNRFVNYLHNPGDGHSNVNSSGRNFVSDIVEDQSGNIWATMYGGGLNRLERSGRYTRFVFPSDSDGTHESWIYTAYQDHRGIFWLESAAGLLTFDPTTELFTRFPSEDLHQASVFGMIQDQRGFLWLSTGIGLVRLDPKNKTLTRFSESQGLPLKELNSDFFVAKGGRMLIGGLEGLTAFYPDSVIESSQAPVIAITGFSVFDKKMAASVFATPEIFLTYDQNFFSFTFAALDYAEPGRNSFEYRMDGIDANWVSAGHRNFATYTNIDPGRYVFRVKGANSENVWNEAGTSIGVVIFPPYWQTWWFRLLAAGCFVSVIYAAYRYRLHKLLDMERLRLRIANDLHDDAGSNLSAIAIMSKAILRAPELSELTRRKITDV